MNNDMIPVESEQSGGSAIGRSAFCALRTSLPFGVRRVTPIVPVGGSMPRSALSVEIMPVALRRPKLRCIAMPSHGARRWQNVAVFA